MIGGFLRSRLRRLRVGRRRTALTIFNYHGVTAEPLSVPDPCFMTETTFARQIETIRRTYRVLSPLEAIEQLERGRPERPAAMLTFDDGFRGFRHVVYPILKETGIPAACFLATAFVGGDDTIWFCRLHHALSETNRRRLPWRGRVIDLSTMNEKARASVQIQDELKSLPTARLEKEIAEIAVSLDIDPAAPVPHDSPFRMLDGEEVREMAGSGLVLFGAHTHRHSILSLLSPAEQREEIGVSIEAVRDLTGGRAEIFAYPNGRRSDYNDHSMTILKEHGVRAAVTTRPGWCSARASLLELPRFWVDEGTPLEEIEAP